MTRSYPRRVNDFGGRPESLDEAVVRALAGEDYSRLLPEFLDTFYGLVSDKALARAYDAIAEPPPYFDDRVRDAFVGATAEHLARRWSLPAIPDWTDDPRRFLDRPYYDVHTQAMRVTNFVQSPLAFRRRLIFIEPEPLRRARMPRASGCSPERRER